MTAAGTPDQLPSPATRRTTDFGGLAIVYDERVLEPRSWTEEQSRWAADLLPGLPAGDVLELCSGAGHIGLLATARSERRLVCVDVNPAAAELTLLNARAAGLEHRLEMRCGRITEQLAPGETFALIIADPPWVRRDQTSRFPEDPLLAIDGGDDGLMVVRECLTAIARHLAPDGTALLQLGPGDQARQVASLLDGTDLVPGEVRRFGERGVVLRIDRRS